MIQLNFYFKRFVMRSFVLSLFILFAFSGCFRSSLGLNKEKELTLNYDAKYFVLSNEVISSEFLNFKDLYVSRYKLKDEDGRIIFYEVAKTDLSFEFNFGGLYTVMYVFDNSQKYESVYEKNNLLLAQIKLKDASYLNVIIQASDAQRYTFAYGFSNAEFLQIANSLTPKETIKELKHNGITFTSSDAPTSNWSVEIVFFAPLITPYKALHSK